MTSSLRDLAVKNTIGMALSIALISWARVKPSLSGIITSKIQILGLYVKKCSRAMLPFSHKQTSKSLDSKHSFVIRPIKGSSSAISTFILVLIG